LIPLNFEQISRWTDLIAPFESRQLFHSPAWLSFLAETQNIECRYWSISDHGRIAGYFCGGLVRKGPFRILGSPLKGWGTNYMGPVVNRDFDQTAFLDALDELAGIEGLSMIELENPVFDGPALVCHDYLPLSQPTYIVELTPGDTQKMWKQFGKRSRVRQAVRFGVQVEDTRDEAIATEYHSQLVEVFRRQGLAPPYPRARPVALFRNLRPKGMLFALRAIDADGETIATGLFPHDDKTLIFWGGACREHAYRLRPNDLMHWIAMELAASQGLRVYNTCGDGLFKSKFGGTLHLAQRWHKSYSRTAEIARGGYAWFHETQMRVRGWYQQNRAMRGGLPLHPKETV